MAGIWWLWKFIYIQKRCSVVRGLTSIEGLRHLFADASRVAGRALWIAAEAIIANHNLPVVVSIGSSYLRTAVGSPMHRGVECNLVWKKKKTKKQKKRENFFFLFFSFLFLLLHFNGENFKVATTIWSRVLATLSKWGRATVWTSIFNRVQWLYYSVDSGVSPESSTIVPI